MNELDAVGLVEQAYDLEAGDDAWLNALVVGARPDFDRGLGMFGMLFGHTSFTRPLASAFIDASKMMAISAELMANPSSEVATAFTTTTDVTSMRRQLSRLAPEELAAWDRAAGKHGVRDMIGLIAHDGEGGAVNIAAASVCNERISAATRERWSRIAAHFGAALRIRRRRAELNPNIAAVLSRDGRLHDASAPLSADRESREALREGTRNMARARGRLRRDEEHALAIWPSMVSGRWSLVEREERDGKHIVEAHANVPRRPPLADLTPLERACAELVRRGQGNKQIAYALGLSLGTVGATLTATMRKLGLRSRVGLIALGNAPSLSDVERVLGETATRAEIAVAALALAGMSNAQIAEQRGVSARTIANQLAKLFTRLGIGSRSQLAALVQAARAKH